MRTTALALVLALLYLQGCPPPRVVPPPVLPDAALQVACDASVKACKEAPTEAACDAAEACSVVLQDAERCRADLGECRGLAAVDVGEQASLKAQALARVNDLERERWFWGLGGTALGALLAGLLAGLVGR